MEANTKEHAEIMTSFEKAYRHLRLDREPKTGWKRGNIYQDGMANELFLAYRRGYAFACCVIETGTR